ncbi:MAG: PilT/PilU family type 4a pilus ATPase [Candidatus Omnitrophica bacterium]|nr:PilT/PilU family type 4a pilus ATPase [Candidatus Omnitrophota bacterium]
MPKLDRLFRILMEHKASDLHLEEWQKPKMRLHGAIREIPGEDVLTHAMILELLSEIVDEGGWERFKKTGDIDFAYSMGHDARFRANYYRQFYGLGAVFRHIPSKIVPLEKLDMPDTMKTFGEFQSGLVLITGPTGSVKSTTLASVIDYINRHKVKKIITIEEPVEFIHTSQKSMMIHREVGLDTESFASGLKSAIKSDAEIILVGEMRDRETIMLALTAAQMGILVFGTLHTNSAAKTIDRIIDVFPMDQKNQIRTVLANTLQGAVSQQLLKSADGSRRWVAYEILLRSSALGPIITEGDVSKLTSEMQTNRAKGMILMDDCLLELVKQGRVTKDDAFMKAVNKAGFMARLGVGPAMV